MVLQDGADPDLLVHGGQLFEMCPYFAQLFLPSLIVGTVNEAESVTLDPKFTCRTQHLLGMRSFRAGYCRREIRHAQAPFSQSFNVRRQFLLDPLRFDLPVGPHRAVHSIQSGLGGELGRLVEVKFERLIRLAEDDDWNWNSLSR